jgi:hypothetical protein
VRPPFERGPVKTVSRGPSSMVPQIRHRLMYRHFWNVPLLGVLESQKGGVHHRATMGRWSLERLTDETAARCPVCCVARPSGEIVP